MRLRLLLPSLLLVLVAGCSGGEELSGGGGGEVTVAEATELVQAAPARTLEGGTSRLEVTVKTTAGERELEVVTAGVQDPAAGEAQLETSLPEAGVSVEQRLVDGRLYVQVPGQGEGFFSLALEDVLGTPLGAGLDPDAQIESLRTARDVEVVGPEDVRGTPTTHYRAVYDAEDQLDRLGRIGEQAKGALGDTDLSALPVDLWLDDDGRLRKLEQVLELQPEGQPPVSIRTVVEVFEFGVDVDVEVPPADQVRDGAPLLELLRSQGAV